MPARKAPSAHDAATARRILLDAVSASDVDVVESLNRLALLHPRNDTFPGEVF